MDVLRDPIWQFVGVVVAVLTAAASGVVWIIKRRRRNDVTRDEEIIAEIKRHLPLGINAVEKHKKRKKDSILLANVTSDFFNQFPVAIGVMAAHLDRIYTPENFGETDWLRVFRRLSAEGYFVPVRERSAKRLKVESLLNPGTKLESMLHLTAQTKKEIAGLDNDFYEKESG